MDTGISCKAARSTDLMLATSGSSRLTDRISGVTGITWIVVGERRVPKGMIFEPVQGLRKFNDGALRTSRIGALSRTDSTVAKQCLKSMMEPCSVIQFDPITMSASHSEVMLNLIGSGSKVGETSIHVSM